MRNRSFSAADGTPLDIIVHSADDPHSVLLVYPCIGGTTRAYMVPHQELVSLGFLVIEYHPRAHGRSKGQMAMETALHDLYRYVSISGIDHMPFVIVAHSAGVNAVLHLNSAFIKISSLYAIQPVFDFQESMRYMYSEGNEEEFIKAISKWVHDEQELRALLPDGKWLNPGNWFTGSYRQHVNEISTSALNLGDFLENFYIPGFNSYGSLAANAWHTQILLSNKDAWYPVSTTQSLCKRHSIPITVVEQAKDHHLVGGWPYLWDAILASLESSRTATTGSS